MEDLSAAGDAEQYIKMSRGDYENVQTRYLRRWLIPSAVSLLRDNIKIPAALSESYEIEEYKLTNLYFGMINVFFLTLSALFLYHFCRDLNFNDWESFSAGLLFLTSFFVITYYTIPMIDSAASFFIMAGYWAVKQRKLFWLTLIFLIGLFVKETTLVLILVLFLDDWRFALKKSFIFIPGVVLYALLSSMAPKLGATIIGNVTDKSSFFSSIKASFDSLNFYTFVENFQILMFLWFLFIFALIYKWREIPIFLKKQMPLLALILVTPFLVNSGAVGRAAFYLFPIMLPVVVLALREVFNGQVKHV
jgi:hypothetical protein